MHICVGERQDTRACRKQSSEYKLCLSFAWNTVSVPEMKIHPCKHFVRSTEKRLFCICSIVLTAHNSSPCTIKLGFWHLSKRIYISTKRILVMILMDLPAYEDGNLSIFSLSNERMIPTNLSEVRHRKREMFIIFS